MATGKSTQRSGGKAGGQPGHGKKGIPPIVWGGIAAAIALVLVLSARKSAGSAAYASPAGDGTATGVGTATGWSAGAGPRGKPPRKPRRKPPPHRGVRPPGPTGPPLRVSVPHGTHTRHGVANS